ncbi:hypothetical protein [Cyprinid herpesvirus 2]|nr:hypothetical protein [Cyprinid herpesvirus 2]
MDVQSRSVDHRPPFLDRCAKRFCQKRVRDSGPFQVDVRRTVVLGRPSANDLRVETKRLSDRRVAEVEASQQCLLLIVAGVSGRRPLGHEQVRRQRRYVLRQFLRGSQSVSVASVSYHLDVVRVGGRRQRVVPSQSGLVTRMIGNVDVKPRVQCRVLLVGSGTRVEERFASFARDGPLGLFVRGDHVRHQTVQVDIERTQGTRQFFHG